MTYPARNHHFDSLTERKQFLDAVIAGAVPFKFAYLGTGAAAHDALARSDVTRLESLATLEAEAVRSLSQGRDVQICDIGPGNGMHSAQVLCGLLSSGTFDRIRYLALDNSFRLMRRSMTRVGAIDRVLVSGKPWDIEKAPTRQIALWRTGGEPVCLLLLGQTLGNVVDWRSALVHLRKSVRSGDALVFSVGTIEEGRSEYELLAPYQRDLFRAVALEPFYSGGFSPDSLELDVYRHRESSMADVIVRRSLALGGSVIDSGTVISYFVSRQFSIQELMVALLDARWRCVLVASGRPTVVAALAVDDRD